MQFGYAWQILTGFLRHHITLTIGIMPAQDPMSHTTSPTSPSTTDHTSWQHIWRLAWPIMLSNVTIPLVGAVDVAMMGRLDDPVFIGGVGWACWFLISSILASGFYGWAQRVWWRRILGAVPRLPPRQHWRGALRWRCCLVLSLLPLGR